MPNSTEVKTVEVGTETIEVEDVTPNTEVVADPIPEVEGSQDASVSGEEENTDESWFVKGRFKTPDDALESYFHVEAEANRLRAENQALKQTKSQPDTLIDEEAELTQFATELKVNPIKTLKNLVKKELQSTGVATTEDVSKSVAFTNKYNHLKSTNPEFVELEPVMTQIATVYGDMIKSNGMQNDPRVLDILYYAAKGLKASEHIKQAGNKGFKKGVTTQIRKQKASVETPTSVKAAPKKKFEELSLEEMRAELLKGN